MLKSLSGVAVAFAVTGLSVPTLSLASSKSSLPTFSGAYQLYGQKFCGQDSPTQETMYTGTYTFYPANQAVQEDVYTANTNVTLFTLRTNYYITANTVTIDGYPWTATFDVDNQGVVRSATLITVYEQNSSPCPQQMLLIR